MSFSNGLSMLFRRDLTRLNQQIEAFPDDASLWSVLPGITNSAGNLVLHLEGNLKEFVGRQLGKLPTGENANWNSHRKDLEKRTSLRASWS